MIIGNKPKSIGEAEDGKLYWQLTWGTNRAYTRMFETGWRTFEFVVFRFIDTTPAGESQPYKIRIAFAYWLPFTRY